MITAKVEGRIEEKVKQLPETLRARLRVQIPILTRLVADRVRAKLSPGVLFKTTTRILPAVRSEMVENPTEIYGRVYIDPARFPTLVAHVLETGARPHVIAARNVSALSFFWGRMGKRVAFRSVNHPGFRGKSYMQSSLDESRAEITAAMKVSVLDAWQES